jgi:hypothetical protein
MKAINLWDDETSLRHVMTPEEDRGYIYPSPTTYAVKKGCAAGRCQPHGDGGDAPGPKQRAPAYAGR